MDYKLIIILIFAAVFPYLLGSCNSAIIVVKIMKKEDIRNFGSKNAGLTNTLRCFGKGPALVTLLSDLVKGVIAISLCRILYRLLEIDDFGHFDIIAIGYIAGFFAIIGHIFPIYYKFKGGKGVLVSATCLLAIDYKIFLIVIPIFIIVLFFTKYVSVSSITAALAYPVVTFVIRYFVEKTEFEKALLHVILVLGTTFMVIIMHKENIKRLKSGTENKFSFNKK